MLRLSGSAPNLDVENAVRDILDEDAMYDNENRNTYRESLVRPVTLMIRGESDSIPAFSRKISCSGIGLVTAVPVPEGATAVLTVESLKGESLKLLAQCRWCRPFGRRWQISGWQFINLHR
ncbi:PilZ domain-containing protein [Roseiconus lacunae]|uniref:PilZ domain-containing protein n=1 Tax=Roseiconus lacunae TaxID=2605694 RepID=A0ABT7PJX4_9BACT|nr:PilZ domain-containing protein [Roseiconus lacunae]MCD0459409.1 PilZ domain-containing protein [Roseiconus lacunae]MDM4016806.1 PilZ domain-containing protein [Roseiconus lacunae]WRQ50881.1 PilZ domain-containing protein [Stieleria sp. HD01]